LPSYQHRKGIMLCYPYSTERLLKWNPPYIIQPKYNGDRCRAVQVSSGDWLLLTSEENIFYSVPHINEALKISGIKNIELDGELYCHGMPHNEIHSIVSRSTNLHPYHTSIEFHIFDYKAEVEQIVRILNLEDLKLSLKPPLIVSPYKVAENVNEVTKIYDNYINLNYEGIIVRNIYANYIERRSPGIMKFKPKETDSYKIIDFEEEVSVNGVLKNRLGSLTLKDNEGNVFSVGSGMSDLDRESLWLKRDELVGKTAVIQYQNLSPKSNVPLFSVFVEVKEFNV